MSVRGCGVRSACVAQHLGVSKVSVTSMIKTLVSEGLVEKERYGTIFLTPQGERVAHQLARTMSLIQDRVPLMGLSLSSEEVRGVAFLLASAFMGYDGIYEQCLCRATTVARACPSGEEGDDSSRAPEDARLPEAQ